MKIREIFRITFLVGCLAVFSLPLFAGEVNLSTYYPAPFGSYDRMRLVPRSSLPLDPHCDDDSDVGKMYYDDGLGEKTAGIYLCQKKPSDTFDWVLMSGFLPPIEEEDAMPLGEPIVGVQKIVCVGADGKMGVCLTNPSADGTCVCQQGVLGGSGK